MTWWTTGAGRSTRSRDDHTLSRSGTLPAAAALPSRAPAGGVRLLDEAMEAAGLDPIEVYITNIVKHFSHITRGGRRFHKAPTRAEIDACRAWIESELQVVRPQVLVCLGARAARTLLGAAVAASRA